MPVVSQMDSDVSLGVAAQQRKRRYLTIAVALAFVLFAFAGVMSAIRVWSHTSPSGDRANSAPTGAPTDAPINRNVLDVLIQRHEQSMNNVGCHVIDTQLTMEGKRKSE